MHIKGWSSGGRRLLLLLSQFNGNLPVCRVHNHIRTFPPRKHFFQALCRPMGNRGLDVSCKTRRLHPGAGGQAHRARRLPRLRQVPHRHRAVRREPRLLVPVETTPEEGSKILWGGCCSRNTLPRVPMTLTRDLLQQSKCAKTSLVIGELSSQ